MSSRNKAHKNLNLDTKRHELELEILRALGRARIEGNEGNTVRYRKSAELGRIKLANPKDFQRALNKVKRELEEQRARVKARYPSFSNYNTTKPRSNTNYTRSRTTRPPPNTSYTRPKTARPPPNYSYTRPRTARQPPNNQGYKNNFETFNKNLQNALNYFGYNSLIGKTKKELKRKYYDLAKNVHPNKGGTNANFQKLGKYYENLTKRVLQ
jgi:hypothetical protein